MMTKHNSHETYNTNRNGHESKNPIQADGPFRFFPGKDSHPASQPSQRIGEVEEEIIEVEARELHYREHDRQKEEASNYYFKCSKSDSIFLHFVFPLIGVVNRYALHADSNVDTLARYWHFKHV
jgi:hypothetical protein